MNSNFTILKKSNGKIKSVRDTKSKIEVTPEQIGLTDNYTDTNIFLLSNNLLMQLDDPKPPHLFDMIDDISNTKECLVDDFAYENAFQPFVINRIFSFAQDCILYANEMNLRPTMPKIHQYKYLMNALRPRKRFIKTHKFEQNQDIECLRSLYNLTNREAKLYYDVIIAEFGAMPKEIIEQYNIIRKNKGVVKRGKK